MFSQTDNLTRPQKRNLLEGRKAERKNVRKKALKEEKLQDQKREKKGRKQV